MVSYLRKPWTLSQLSTILVHPTESKLDMTQEKKRRNVVLNNAIIFGAPLIAACGYAAYGLYSWEDKEAVYTCVAIVVFSTVVCGGLFAMKTLQQRTLQNNGILVTASLASSSSISSQGQVPCKFAYEVDGKTYEKKFDVMDEEASELEMGKRFQLIVDPSNPKRCCPYKYLFSDRETNIVE